MGGFNNNKQINKSGRVTGLREGEKGVRAREKLEEKIKDNGRPGGVNNRDAMHGDVAVMQFASLR